MYAKRAIIGTFELFDLSVSDEEIVRHMAKKLRQDAYSLRIEDIYTEILEI